MIRLALAAAFVVVTSVGAFAQQKTITFSHLANPSHEAALYAIKQDIVTSDKITVEVTPLDIAALQQAIAARTFDVVEGAAMAVPRANARGLPLEIIGIGQRANEAGQGANVWVKADSGIQEPEDLRGKRVGVYTLSSAGVTLIRIALNQIWGLDVDTRNGDFTFVELPETALAAALAADNVDAAALIHAQAYEAIKSGEFRPVARTGEAMNEKFGLQTVTSVLVGYRDKLAEDPQSYREFLRMFRESVDYALANQDEVFAAVGDAEGIEPEFFHYWFNEFSSIPVYVSQNDLDAIDMLWEQSTALGVLDVPHLPAKEAVWENAIFEGQISE